MRIPKIDKQWWHIGLDIPYALPVERFNNDPSAETWESWRVRMLREHPIRYPIYQFIWDLKYWLFDSQFSWHYRFKWWVLHKFHPKHQYHIIKPRTLNPNYYDSRELILHAAMECLCSYMEHEANDVAWYHDWNLTIVYKKMCAIHYWWTVTRPTRIIDWGTDPDPFKTEELFDLEDNKMLKDLIDIRLHLW